jgi:hypothetical protein
MAQRQSEYVRQDADSYWTPAWVFDALHSVEDFAGAFDCAPRNAADYDYDFLHEITTFKRLATNPPFRLADAFVNHALNLTYPEVGKVAMLLPHAWDAAKGRRNLFEGSSPFKAKHTLTKRIRWENLEQKKNGPSMNHAWFVWDWGYQGKPFMGWI